MKKELQTGTQLHRSFQVERAAVNDEARTVELAFASETPYERYWGIEILDLAPQSVRLGRLTSGGPLLMDHNSRDHIGVIESVQIGVDRVGRAVVRFGKSARAEEIFQDVKDGIRRNVSVGYIIHKAQLVETNEENDTFRVSDWEPYEVSLVSVPADTSVGVGRSADQTEQNPVIHIQEPQIKEHKMSEINHEENQQRAVKDALSGEQKRVAEIIAIGEQFAKFGADKLATEALRSGEPVDAFRAKVLEKVSTNPMKTSDVGMTEKETRNYSIVRLMHSLANPTDTRARESAAFEIEVGRAAADKQGRECKGVVVPFDVLKRVLTVGTGAGSTAGQTVATNLLSGSFIDMLRDRLVISGMGAQMLDGLVGNIAIPRLTGGATAYWVDEEASANLSDQGFDQVSMTPRTLAARTKLSRKLLIQSSVAIENLVQSDLAKVAALAIQSDAITSILATSGIGSVAGGTNGAAPTWDHIVDLETAIAIANADSGTMGYLTNNKVRGKLKKTFTNSTYGDEPVWGTDQLAAAIGGGFVNGYQAAVTNAVPSNLTKGTANAVASAIIFGNFEDLILGMWGGLEIQVDPYSGGDTGAVIVRAFQDVDVAVRHAESFAAMKDALTA